MTDPAPPHRPDLQAFQDALDALRAGRLEPADCCRRLRQAPVPPQLPARFAQVLADLLDRLESGALFSGESCSFSQADLHAGLQQWIDQAARRLGPAGDA